MKEPVMVGYGGGKNSTAMLIGLVERGERPDAILFADTGGEKPETYEFIPLFSRWLQAQGFPEIVTVRNAGPVPTLEQDCLTKQMLPSIAYGRRACSEKWKQRPQHRWAKQWPLAQQAWAAGQYVVKLLGYHDLEFWRGRDLRIDGFYTYRYPLQEWKWGPPECEAAILRAGLPLPPKSACFFCPSSKKSEVSGLAERHPELFQRAVEMEQAAVPTLEKGKGLGWTWNWGEYVAGRLELQTVRDPTDIGCLCQSEVWAGEGIDLEEEDGKAKAD